MPFPARNAERCLAYAAAWLALAAVYVGSFVASGASAALALRAATILVVPSALLGLVTLAATRRLFARDPDSGLVRAMLAAAGISLAATAAWSLLAVAEAWLRLGSPRLPAANIVAWQAVLNGIAHVALAAVACAWLSTQQARLDRELAEHADALRARAELQLLRTQLNPHFLLNTLHALLGLVRREPATAERAIERLGDLLRSAMSVTQRKDDRISLREEWDLVRNYLELEQLRLGDRLAAELDASPEALELPVPPFALQPLVENAVVHAIAPRAAGGRLRITARRAAGRLILAVGDDGPGATETDLLASPRSGLRLLRERLAFLYGDAARLGFDRDGGGLRVSLELPESGPQEAP